MPFSGHGSPSPSAECALLVWARVRTLVCVGVRTGSPGLVRPQPKCSRDGVGSTRVEIEDDHCHLDGPLDVHVPCGGGAEDAVLPSRVTPTTVGVGTKDV